MLTVRLATTPNFLGSTPTPQSLGGVNIKLETLPTFQTRGPGTHLNQFSMPTPGRVMSDAVAPGPSAFVLRVVLQCGKDVGAFVVGPVGENDILSITGGQAPSPTGGGAKQSIYAGSIIHANPQDPNPCRVRCDSGPVMADDCCIVCTVGSTTVKFCC